MQGQRLLQVVLGGVAAFSMTTSALALEMSVPDGWYGEGNIGVAHLSKGPSGTTNQNGPTYNVNLGYKFMPYAALEAGYTKYKNTKIVLDGISLAEISHYSFDLAAKAILPISDTGFEAFAKLGANHMRTKASNINTTVVIDNTAATSANSTSVYLGLGGQFNIMSELGIVVQWQRAQGNNNTGNEDLYSIGVAFIFV